MTLPTEHAATLPTDHTASPETIAHRHKHDDHVPEDGYFIKIAVILAVVTALETSTYWWPESARVWSTPALLIMMAIKFFMIVSVFMHLKFDSKIFSFMFYTGLVLAIFVYCVFLFTFQFFRP